MQITIDSKAYEQSTKDMTLDLANSAWFDQQRNAERRKQRGKKLTASDMADLLDTIGGQEEIAQKVRTGKLKPIEGYLQVSKKYSELDDEQQEKLYGMRRTIMDFHEQDKEEKTADEIKTDYLESWEKTLNQSLENAEKAKKLVSSAISRIEGWGNTPVIIELPKKTERDDWYDPNGTLSVKIGKGRRAPDFTLFINNETGNFEDIGDVIEANDPDFFGDPIQQKNYFDLIAELEKPGSTKKPGKKLRLYTARPVKDRRLYTNAKKVPVGIFLTSDPDRAMGIAGDLSGREKRRDLWSVRIDSRYLVKTLDTGRIKDYQVVGGHKTVPVFSMELLEEGTESIRPPRLSHRIMEARKIRASKLKYIHFTDTAGALGMLTKKEIWQSNWAEDAVYAVAVGGEYNANTQRHKLGRATERDVAVLFTTNEFPDVLKPWQVLWHKPAIKTTSIKIIPMSQALKMLDGSLVKGRRKRTFLTGVPQHPAEMDWQKGQMVRSDQKVTVARMESIQTRRLSHRIMEATR